MEKSKSKSTRRELKHSRRVSSPTKHSEKSTLTTQPLPKPQLGIQFTSILELTTKLLGELKENGIKIKNPRNCVDNRGQGYTVTQLHHRDQEFDLFVLSDYKGPFSINIGMVESEHYTRLYVMGVYDIDSVLHFLNNDDWALSHKIRRHVPQTITEKIILDG